VWSCSVEPVKPSRQVGVARFGRGVADASMVTVEVERAETLRKWLLKSWKGPEILPSDVIRNAPSRTLRESPAARSAITTLVDHGWLVKLEPGTVVRGKMRKEAYRIVRSGHEV
jgi:hypothetical protein